MSKYQDTIIAVLLVGFAGFFAYETSKISEEAFRRASGIVYYPLLLSVSLAVASLLLLVKSLMRPRGAGEAEGEDEVPLRDEDELGIKPGSGNEAEPEKESEADTERGAAAHTLTGRVLPVLLGVAILAVYILALAFLGFIVSTPVMLVALLLAYGVRNWKVIASLSIGVTAVIYLVFYYMLGIQLP